MIKELLNTITQSTEIPLLTALLLGLLTALNPCQLAINISALTYLVKKGKPWTESVTYIAGRAATYTLLGWVLMCLIGGGSNIEALPKILSQAETVLPWALLIIGVVLIIRAFHTHHHCHGEECHNSGEIIRVGSPFGSFILGMTLALAFCPESALFYFGMMIPLAQSTAVGILVPPLFAIAAVLPIFVLVALMTKAISSARHFTHAFQHFQQIINVITGIIFIVLAIWVLAE